MKIAIFLDVDKTLTRNFIQHEYAKQLNCEGPYNELELQFQRKEVTSTEFGERTITLFATNNFREQNSRMLLDKIALQPWADELLRMKKIDKYLVSSGPNYYIDALAERYKIPDENICRSIYKFHKDTGLIESCAAVDGQQKAFFVKD